MEIYQYVVLQLDEDGEYEDIIDAAFTLAADPDEVRMRAARELPEDTDMARVKVVVRPF